MEYTYKDIDNEDNLKEFYAMRDKHEIYNSIKAAGKYGIPSILIDGEPHVDVMNQTAIIKEKLGLK